jgi:hypothetical protein
MPQSKTVEMSGASQPRLMPLVTGYMSSRVIHVAAELGIADLLVEGTKTSDDLAAQARLHAPSLHRLLRALASLGLVDEIEPGGFALTALGAQLRSDAPDSLRQFARMSGSERSWRCWGDLLHCVRTGQTAMQHLYAVGSFEYFAAHPKEAAIFNAAMAESTRRTARAVIAAYDFSRFRALVDVGGGNGMLMAAILAATPGLCGIVFDLPSGNADAPGELATAGLAERGLVASGDFFHSVPSGADGYILKSVIHDWDDERSIAILAKCRKSIAADGKLLLVECVMPARMDASPTHLRAAMLDIHMLALPGGRERTGTEYGALFAAAGFELSRILPLPEALGMSLIEGVPT